jgi:hypothetical protein
MSTTSRSGSADRGGATSGAARRVGRTNRHRPAPWPARQGNAAGAGHQVPYFRTLVFARIATPKWGLPWWI